MRISPNARRSGRIEDLRGTGPFLPAWIPRPGNPNAASEGDYVYTGMADGRIARRAMNVGQGNSRVTDYGQRLTPAIRGRRFYRNLTRMADSVSNPRRATVR